MLTRTYLHPDRGNCKIDDIKDYIDNGRIIEIRHAFLDSAIDAEQVYSYLKKVNNKDKIRHWDFSKISLEELFKPKIVFKAFERIEVLNPIREAYKNEKQEKRSSLRFCDYLVGIVSSIGLLLDKIGTSAVTLINGVSISVYQLILIAIGISLLIDFIDRICFIYSEREKKQNYYLKKIEEWLHKDENKEKVCTPFYY
jgi:hypothetical protein